MDKIPGSSWHGRDIYSNSISMWFRISSTKNNISTDVAALAQLGSHIKWQQHLTPYIYIMYMHLSIKERVSQDYGPDPEKILCKTVPWFRRNVTWLVLKVRSFDFSPRLGIQESWSLSRLRQVFEFLPKTVSNCRLHHDKGDWQLSGHGIVVTLWWKIVMEFTSHPKFNDARLNMPQVMVDSDSILSMQSSCNIYIYVHW